MSTVPTIWLIPEDIAGLYIFQAILREKKITANLRRIGEANGINELAKRIDSLIQTVLRSKRQTDCIVVIHDTDDGVETNREKYEKIRIICEKYGSDVTRLASVQEIEAWLLADNSLCKWLKVSPNKKADHIPKPSKEFERLLNKKKQMKWNERTKQKVLVHMDASGDEFSPSMREAVQIFLNLPCTQAKK